MIPPLQRDPRYQTLDLWRGAICLLVLLEHTTVGLWAGSGGATGIDAWLRWAILAPFQFYFGAPMFLVISGYCIAASVDSARRRGTTPLAFLHRRFWRIYPTYWMSVLWCLLVVSALDFSGLAHWHKNGYAIELSSPRDLDAWQWLGNLTLAETWRPLVGGRESVIYTRVAWSLCYQEQFYLICFLVLLAAPRRLYGALAAVTVAVVAFRVVAWDAGALHRIHGTFPVLWHEFAIGLAVYWRLNVAESPAARRGVELGLLGLLAIGWREGVPSTIATALFGLALIALRPWDGRLDRLAALDPLRACGRRSFSLYLVHLPVITVGNTLLWELGVTGFWARAALTVPLVASAAIGVAWAFFHLVERHFIEVSGVPRGASGHAPKAATGQVMRPATLPA